MEQTVGLYEAPAKDVASIVGKRMLLPGTMLAVVALALCVITQWSSFLFLLFLPLGLFVVQFFGNKNNLVLCGSCLDHRRKSEIERRAALSHGGGRICDVCHHYYSERSV